MLREPGGKEGLHEGGAGPEGVKAEEAGRGGGRGGGSGVVAEGKGRGGGGADAVNNSSLGVSSLLPGTGKSKTVPALWVFTIQLGRQNIHIK